MTTTGATTSTAGGDSGATGAATTGDAGGSHNGAGSGSGDTNPPSWLNSLNPDLKGYVENKGFKEPATVVESYRNLEKLIGVPQERLLKLPEKEDDPAWGEIFNRLGRPTKAEEYAIKAPDGSENELTKWAKGAFHELGITAKQAEKLVNKWNELQGTQTAAKEEAKVAESVAQEAALKKKWGAAYDHNLKVAKLAAIEFGLDAKAVDKLQDAIGYDGALSLLHTIGARVGEGHFVTGDTRGHGFANAPLSPDAAKNKITSLKQDTAFVQKYNAGDAAAREEMTRLHQWAYPDTSEN